MKKKVKDLALDLGADLCGLAHIQAFREAPAGFHPSDILGSCRSVLVLAKRLPRGAAGVDPRIVYNRANELCLLEVDRIAFLMAAELDKWGVTAVSLPSDGPYDHWEPEVLRGRGVLSLRHAAVLAGLGRLGRNTLVINEKLGNMMAIGAVLTDLELKTDPPAAQLYRPKCRRCQEVCPALALGEKDAPQTVDQSRCRPQAYGTNPRGFGVVNCNDCRVSCPLAFGLSVNRSDCGPA